MDMFQTASKLAINYSGSKLPHSISQAIQGVDALVDFLLRLLAPDTCGVQAFLYEFGKSRSLRSTWIRNGDTPHVLGEAAQVAAAIYTDDVHFIRCIQGLEKKSEAIAIEVSISP